MELRDTLKYYKGKRVLITGHTGFKGSWLAYIIDSIGAEITGYSLEPNTEPSLFKSLSFSRKFNSIIGDIRDKEKFKETVQKFNPEFIFHLAAQPLVLESYNNPKDTFDTNFTGTLNLLEILRELDLSVQVLFVTTDKVYENLGARRPAGCSLPAGNSPASPIPHPALLRQRAVAQPRHREFEFHPMV